MLSKPQLPSGEDSNWRWQFFLGSVGVVIMSWAVGGFVIAAIRKT
jgi:capsular polysaccharide transport system permease protein